MNLESTCEYRGIKIEIYRAFVGTVVHTGGQSLQYEPRAFINGADITDRLDLKNPASRSQQQVMEFIDLHASTLGATPLE